MDSWISFILAFTESKNIHQASSKANEKAGKFVVKSEVCMILQQAARKNGFLRFFLNLLLQAGKSFNRMRTTYADLAQ
ncbi:hypothetical protein SO574_13200 [Vibrio alfacsensis]|uniref:hypothetical protein n=1 Tax=Vibrio alfacsensis TaxID=1074311 RepID=UPI002ADE74F6|nr:hypothetical protein [Vibrio alfacsensis]WQE76089.1 hypothetical protein SO574_13200 [Vibrio alfacsensis]